MGLIIFGFLTGILMRKFSSWRRKIILGSAILFFLGHLGLFFLPNTASPEPYHYGIVIVFLFFMSLKYSVYYSAILTSVSYFVDQNFLGSAWGIICSTIGLSRCVMPLIQMKIIDSDTNLGNSYKMLSLFVWIFSFISLGFSILINCCDFSTLDQYYKDVILTSK